MPTAKKMSATAKHLTPLQLKDEEIKQLRKEHELINSDLKEYQKTGSQKSVLIQQLTGQIADLNERLSKSQETIELFSKNINSFRHHVSVLQQEIDISVLKTEQLEKNLKARENQLKLAVENKDEAYALLKSMIAEKKQWKMAALMIIIGAVLILLACLLHTSGSM